MMLTLRATDISFILIVAPPNIKVCCSQSVFSFVPAEEDLLSKPVLAAS